MRSSTTKMVVFGADTRSVFQRDASLDYFILDTPFTLSLTITCTSSGIAESPR